MLRRTGDAQQEGAGNSIDSCYWAAGWNLYSMFCCKAQLTFVMR